MAAVATTIGADMDPTLIPGVSVVLAIMAVLTTTAIMVVLAIMVALVGQVVLVTTAVTADRRNHQPAELI